MGLGEASRMGVEGDGGEWMGWVEGAGGGREEEVAATEATEATSRIFFSSTLASKSSKL